ncbi:T9SS type A sorting domain-containing protein, partial [candidate division KSB1 bacterium]|nr:T9SS type A sorting domain-containing protein [candidate division KSB1 bacterium]
SVPLNAQQQRVVIKIFDLTGRLVRVLFDREVAPGRYEVIWDGRDAHNNELVSGTYVYRLETGNNVITKKMLLIH